MSAKIYGGCFLMYLFSVYQFTDQSIIRGKGCNKTRSITNLSFPGIYHATGNITIRSAGIREPFEIWYAGKYNRSRIDYYGGTVQTYQRADIGKYGTLFEVFPKYDYRSDNHYRGCWKKKGNKKKRVQPQGILPKKVYWPFEMNVSQYKYSGNELVNGKNCSKWIAKIKAYNRTDTYTFYATEEVQPKPVKFEMQGYDVLLVSYYDHYVIDYDSFGEWNYDSKVFNTPKVARRDRWCQNVPKGTGEAGYRSLNPMGDFMDEDNNYNHFQSKFNHFRKAFKKNYKKEEEYHKRMHIARHNMRYIHSMNRKQLGFQLDVNHFTDLSDDEYGSHRGLSFDDLEDTEEFEKRIPVLSLESEELQFDKEKPSQSKVEDINATESSGEYIDFLEGSGETDEDDFLEGSGENIEKENDRGISNSRGRFSEGKGRFSKGTRASDLISSEHKGDFLGGSGDTDEDDFLEGSGENIEKESDRGRSSSRDRFGNGKERLNKGKRVSDLISSEHKGDFLGGSGNTDEDDFLEGSGDNIEKKSDRGRSNSRDRFGNGKERLNKGKRGSDLNSSGHKGDFLGGSGNTDDEDDFLEGSGENIEKESDRGRSNSRDRFGNGKERLSKGKRGSDLISSGHKGDFLEGSGERNEYHTNSRESDERIGQIRNGFSSRENNSNERARMIVSNLNFLEHDNDAQVINRENIEEYQKNTRKLNEKEKPEENRDEFSGSSDEIKSLVRPSVESSDDGAKFFESSGENFEDNQQSWSGEGTRKVSEDRGFIEGIESREECDNDDTCDELNGNSLKKANQDSFYIPEQSEQKETTLIMNALPSYTDDNKQQKSIVASSEQQRFNELWSYPKKSSIKPFFMFGNDRSNLDTQTPDMETYENDFYLEDEFKFPVEFRHWYSRKLKRKLSKKKKKQGRQNDSLNKIPENLDWREYGAVAPIQSQGICGSCWSFSTTAAVESAHFLKFGKLEKLSEQQLIDCTWYVPHSKDGNHACMGGWTWKSFAYIKEFGIATSESYGKYVGMESSCKRTNVTTGASIDSFMKVKANDAKALKTAIALYGPATASINTEAKTLKFYSKGIYNDRECTGNTDHSVLIVGYGEEHGKLYWVVRNSWGTTWGENGYIKIENGRCGLLKKPWVIINRPRPKLPWMVGG